MANSFRSAASHWRSAVACACLVPALASAGQATAAPQPAFIGTNWSLISLAGHSVSQDGSQPHVAFRKSRSDRTSPDAHSSGMLVNASDGCNQFTGSFERDDSSLHITVGPSTALACATPLKRDSKGSIPAQPAMSFGDALRKTARFEIHGGSLLLEDQDGAILARFVSN